MCADQDKHKPFPTLFLSDVFQLTMQRIGDWCQTENISTHNAYGMYGIDAGTSGTGYSTLFFSIEISSIRALKQSEEAHRRMVIKMFQCACVCSAWKTFANKPSSGNFSRIKPKWEMFQEMFQVRLSRPLHSVAPSLFLPLPYPLLNSTLRAFRLQVAAWIANKDLYPARHPPINVTALAKR